MGSVARWFGGQLARPHGPGGWLVGQAMRAANREPTRLAVEALGLTEQDVALDLGCGSGAGVALLGRRASRVYGIDASPTMVAMARRINRREVARGIATIEQGLFDALPLADRSVDKVLAVNVAYFWHDFAPILIELRRVIRPGGRLAIYVTDRDTMRHWRFADFGLHRQFDAADLSRALRAAATPADAIAIEAYRLPMGIGALICVVTF